MDALKFIHVGDTFNTTLLEVVWIIVGFLVLFWYCMCVWYMASGKGFRCTCYCDVYAADFQESKGGYNKCTYKRAYACTV